jgi:uncharacterized protein YjbI with pentapeptide repeats
MKPSASQGRAGWRRWLGWSLAGVAGAAVLTTALWFCIAVLPQRLYPPLSNADLAGLSPADQAARREGRAKLQNDARTALLQGLAALLVLSGAGIGAAVTLRQVRIGREQLEQARQQARRSDKRVRKQIAVAQEGQITERFTRAVDQLGQPGPDRLDVRLGGIYALERIAQDSPTHRLAVVEILTAFIRSHAPWPPRLPGQYRADAPIDELPSLQTRAPDIQAGLTVIGRRPTHEDDPGLDLMKTDLREANLGGANLTRAGLARTNLTKAWLSRADLTKALLDGAVLTGAQLTEANLTGAQLFQADLTKAWLSRADLTEAWLKFANLTGAWLDGANLTGAQLDDANLMGAQLEGANLTGAQLVLTNLTEARLDGADLTGAQLEGANLTEARLARTSLTKAQLTSTILMGAQLKEANLTEARLTRVNLVGARLFAADLTRAWLHDVNLTGARLFGADLTEAWLHRANLTRARLDRANLTGARLEGANLTGARLDDANLTGAQLGNALANHETVWPDGWDRTRRAAAGIDEPDEEAPPAASPPGCSLDP